MSSSLLSVDNGTNDALLAMNVAADSGPMAASLYAKASQNAQQRVASSVGLCSLPFVKDAKVYA